MRKSTTVIAAVLLTIITASFAMAFRPASKTGKWETSQNESSTSQTAASNLQAKEVLTDKASGTEMHLETTTVQVNLTESTEKLTTETTGTTRHSLKLVSRLQEQVIKDRNWLSKRETTIAATEISPAEFRRDGVVYSGGYRYTWYSENVLPGKDLDIPGRHSDGDFVKDGDNNIVLASCDLPKGTVVQTPFGPGKVYDYCPTSGTIDVYVSW